MSETEKKIMAIFGMVIPTMTEREKERLLDFGDGMRFMASQRTQPEQVQRPGAQAKDSM